MAVAVLAGCSADQPAPTRSPTPSAESVIANVNTMVVLGDSMSLGVNACAEPGQCPEESWAAGTDAQVDSLADRIGEHNGTRPVVDNLSRAGGRLGDAVDNAELIAANNPDLFVMLLGANDACRSSIGSMTSPDDFATGLQTLFSTITAVAPASHLLVMSVPDLNRLWDVNHDNPAAIRLWRGSSSCSSLLGDPQSTDPADEQRRADVADRVDAYNDALATACAAMPKCTFDDGALHAVQFEQADISTIDYFHPGVTAQEKIADTAWTALQQMG